MDKKNFKGYLYLLPSIIIMIAFTLYPLVRAIIMSFLGDYNIINDSFKSVGFDNYKALFSDPAFGKSLRNTAIYVVCVVPASIQEFMLFVLFLFLLCFHFFLRFLLTAAKRQKLCFRLFISYHTLQV